jgi:hypothetical protein
MAILLVLALLGFGTYEVYRYSDDSLRKLILWGVSVVASGAIVAVGVFARRHFPDVGTALLVVGCVVAAIPTMRTVVLPALALVVVVLALRDHSRTGMDL